MVIKVNKKTMFYSALLFITILPSSIINYLGIVTLVNMIRYLALAISAMIDLKLNLFQRRHWQLIHLWLFWMIFSTILNGGSLYTAVQNTYPLFITVILTYYLYVLGDGWRKTLLYMFAFMLACNLYTLFAGGLYRENIYFMAYFFGIRVNINDVLIFAISIMLLGACLGRVSSRIVCSIGCICGIAFVFLQWVSTAIVTLAMFSLFYLYVIFAKKWENKKKYIRIAAIVLFFGIIYFAFNPNVQRFSWLIEDMLGESLTLDGRTDIWESCISQIKSIHWLIGHGLGHDYYFAISNGAKVAHPHNQYLAILFNFGIIGILIYGGLLWQQVKLLMNETDNQIRAIICGCLFASLIMGIGATYYGKVYWLLWHTICLILIDQLEEEKACNHKGYSYIGEG